MAGGFRAALIALIVLAGCVQVPRGGGPQTPEEELARRAAALQRTIQEAAVAGAAAGAGGAYVFGGRGGMPAGILVGIPVGITAGTYLGFLQQRYATREARLARLKADIDASNAETAAAIATMRVVLDRQRAELASLRASGDEGLREEVREAQASLDDMARAIDGAENRVAEFQSTRGLRLAQGQLTGVDAELAELTARIADMRAVAQTLANEL